MVKKELVVQNIFGIHARPASLIVKAANNFLSKITLKKEDLKADAKSIMEVTILAAPYNSKVTIIAEGPDEKKAIESITELFNIKFNED